MLNALVSLFVSLLFAMPPPPMAKLDPAVIWSQVDKDGTVSLLFDNGGATTMQVDSEGSVSVSSADAMIPQGPSTTGPTPSITTSYKDEDGMTHTINTPIVSTTEAGLNAALETHRKLVRLMKGIYPPASP